jgi:16S rRNA processing protein RimM
MGSSWEEMAVVGRIARTHGLRGQVVINVETDFPQERFQAGAEVFARSGDAVESLTITTVRFQGERPVVGLSSVEDIDSAARLVGAELRVPIERLARLPEGTFYRHELTGCRVQTNTGNPVGVVVDVEGTMGGSRLVVESPKGEVLVPLAEEFCLVIDPGQKRIVIRPPEGLLELNERMR